MGTLSGKIVDADGNPVAAARIWMSTFDAKTYCKEVLVDAQADAEGALPARACRVVLPESI